MKTDLGKRQPYLESHPSNVEGRPDSPYLRRSRKTVKVICQALIPKLILFTVRNSSTPRYDP